MTDRQNYMCPPPTDSEGAFAPSNDLLVEVSRSCLPIFNAAERVRWVATTTPGWLPLVVRNVVRDEPIAIGNIYLGH